jgi:uncharacterized protein
MKQSRSLPNAWLASLLLPCLSACMPQGQALVQSPVPPGISVSGHGEARGKPDIARVTIGVETRGSIATEATEQANRQMSAVTAAIQKHGVSEADIRTQNFSINFEQPPEPYPPSPQPLPQPVPRKGAAPAALDLPRGFYRVSNQMLVTVRKLDDLGALLTAVTSAGANNIWGIQLEIEDPTPLEAEARQRAVAEAKARAEQLARLAGVKLGRVVSISANGGGPIMHEGGSGFRMKATQTDVPVQRGELTISQDVQLVYALE